MARIGVFVCHCGENIAGTVDVKAVADAVADMPGVVISEDYRYMCSDPGQALIADRIKQHDLTAVVVAACSPQMHEKTFRTVCENAGLNPFFCEIANIREQCSWVHHGDHATAKAIDMVRVAVAKVRRAVPLNPITVPVTRRVLVIGGGIAGIQAAVDIADAGYPVTLVERSPSIGGRMAQLSETFPTLDCSQCILTPRMVELARHPNVTLLTYAEIEKVEGFIGNFQVTIRQKARSVRLDLCTGCGQCLEACPQRKVTDEFEGELSTRSAIYRPFPQAVPNKPVIDRDACLRFRAAARKGLTATEVDVCGKCYEACPLEPTKAIDFADEDKLMEERFGAIVVATGFDVGDGSAYGEYLYGNDPDIVTGLQFERLLSASGPTGGEMRRPSDGEPIRSVAFIQCVGSRDRAKGREYCSKICCMYTAKQTILFKHKVHDGQAFVFYIDIRTAGKGYEEFSRRAMEEERAIYFRGRVSRVFRRGKKLVVFGADTLSGRQVRVEVDLVVLATAALPRSDSRELAHVLGIATDKDGFFQEAHPKLRPVETSVAGIFLAGACQGPKDIPETVAQASGAASKAISVIARDTLTREPTVAQVDRLPPPRFSTCIGCFACREVCPVDAIEEEEIRDRSGKLIKTIARVNEAVCIGCGVCTGVCRSKAIQLRGTSDEQVLNEILALAP